jgi:DNA-directed RNA polymerase subunit RPC12/RpoP
MRYESNIKPEVCPACGSQRIAKIKYGKLKETPELHEMERTGQVIRGGCCITFDNPRFRCLDCLTNIYSKSKNVSV